MLNTSLTDHDREFGMGRNLGWRVGKISFEFADLQDPSLSRPIFCNLVYTMKYSDMTAGNKTRIFTND